MRELTALDIEIGTLKGMSRTSPMTIVNTKRRKMFEDMNLVRSEPYGKGFVSYLTAQGQKAADEFVDMGCGRYIPAVEVARLSALAEAGGMNVDLSRLADREILMRLLSCDSDGTATAAVCEDIPVPKDCQARAESIAQDQSHHPRDPDNG